MKKILAVLLIALASWSLLSCVKKENETVVNCQEEEKIANIQFFVASSWEDFESNDFPILKENVPYLFTIYIEGQFDTMVFMPHTSYTLIQFNIKDTNGVDCKIQLSEDDRIGKWSVDNGGLVLTNDIMFYVDKL